MALTPADGLRLVHPALAIATVFPILGIVLNRAWLVRSRRLTIAAKEKSKIPPQVGGEHRDLGKWLTGSVVGITLLGMVHPIFKTLLANDTFTQAPFQAIWIILMFVGTIGALVCLYRAESKQWRAIFATLTGMGLIVIGAQDGVYRRSSEWFISHYYYGIAAALLMVVSLAMLPEIYRSLTWRRVHIGLNIAATLFFFVQGLTGARDLLEIPLSWQESHVYRCNFELQTCPEPTPPPPAPGN